MTELPIGLGDSGEAVADIRNRLLLAGCEVRDSQSHEFTQFTREAVLLFQSIEGLPETGRVDRDTWSALIEASRALGDRPLYLRQPMLRGQDVVDLQHLLGKLGFDAGWADGFFGPQTAQALVSFQQNTGLNDDGICGPGTFAMLNRVASRSGEESVASLRERERLLSLPRTLKNRQIALGETGGLGALAEAIHRDLRSHEARCSVLRHPDFAVQADQANQLSAELYIGFELHNQPVCKVAYFATDKFVSPGGRRFAEIVAEPLGKVIGDEVTDNQARGMAPGVDPQTKTDPQTKIEPQTMGMRLLILQMTRMPAVWLSLGPPAAVVENTAEISGVILDSVLKWVAQPV